MCLDDTRCIELCLAGQPETFRHLVTRYQGPLTSFLAGRLGNREQAEEVAQETFVRAYCNLAKMKKPESFLAWLMGIALRALERGAEASVSAPAGCEGVGGRAARTGAAPADCTLERVVSDLPEPHRQIVLLRYFGGRTCAEVASHMQMPLGTVTKYLSRAYVMLRDSLRNQDDSQRSEVLP